MMGSVEAGQVEAFEEEMIDAAETPVDPLGDQERLQEEKSGGKNYAKVGSSRSSTLLYTYGPGAVMDMSHFTVMPMGLDMWERIYDRRDGDDPRIHAPRLLETAQLMLGPQVNQLRAFPWQPNREGRFRENVDLGVPARVFPQWLRCTGCNRLAPVAYFKRGYRNSNPYRPEEAEFLHLNCSGRSGVAKFNAPCIPARYLLVCPGGHIDEFPYDWWVHDGKPCSKAPDNPFLKLVENSESTTGAGVACASCGSYRSMAEALSPQNRAKLPRCRGRYAHLDKFEKKKCDKEPRVMLIGASNLWFPLVQGIIDIPLHDEKEILRDRYDKIRAVLGPTAGVLFKKDAPNEYLDIVITTLNDHTNSDPWMKDLGVDDLRVMLEAGTGEDMSEEEMSKRRERWSPTDLLVPEWNYFLNNKFSPNPKDNKDEQSGLTVHTEELSDVVKNMGIARIIGVDSLRKINALFGFTRIDAYDRADDAGSRLVPLTSNRRPQWIPAVEDRGEGIFIQFDEEAVAEWENTIKLSPIWQAYVEANRRHFQNRRSDTSDDVNPDDRMPVPRYWLLHTFSHAMIKRMAMSSGYGIPSLSERIYAWEGDENRPAAAGVLIVTTASDSDGTLGGLVSLGEKNRFEQVLMDALEEMRRCSSDPICAMRIPSDPEDYLHGAACHCCCMVSETSCEKANQYLDRRMVVQIPGAFDMAFFKD